LDVDAPQQHLAVSAQLPAEWGRVTLTDLTIGAVTVNIEAEGQDTKVTGLPPEWSLTGSA
jgi:hypothetical protein